MYAITPTQIKNSEQINKGFNKASLLYDADKHQHGKISRTQVDNYGNNMMLF